MEKKDTTQQRSVMTAAEARDRLTAMLLQKVGKRSAGTRRGAAGHAWVLAVVAPSVEDGRSQSMVWNCCVK